MSPAQGAKPTAHNHSYKVRLARVNALEHDLPQLGEEIDGQRVPAEHFEEIGPAALLRLGDDADQDRKNDEVDSDIAQHKRAGPDLLVDREDCIPPQAKAMQIAPANKT